MTPEVLHSLTAARGAQMPVEDSATVDHLAALFRRERRLRELVARLKRSGEISDDNVTTMARYFGCQAAGANTKTFKAPEWSHAECAQAGQGLDGRYWMAMRYTYALDDSVFHSLWTRLWEWGLAQREHESYWPMEVLDNDGKSIRYMRDLVCVLLLEIRRPSAFKDRDGTKVDLHQLLMNVTDRVWKRRLSPVYEAVGEEYLSWLSIARRHMDRRLAQNDG